MKKTFAILFASTALAAGIGLPAWSAMQGVLRLDERPRPAAFIGSPQSGAMPLLVSDDDDGDRHHGRRLRHGGDDHDDGDGEDDDDSRPGNVSAPAPAGGVAPPQNGLFGSGAAPKVQVN